MGCGGSKPASDVVAQPAVTIKAEIAPPSPRASVESDMGKVPAASEVATADVELLPKPEPAAAEDMALATDIVSDAVTAAIDISKSADTPTPAKQETAPQPAAAAPAAAPAAEPTSPGYAVNYEETTPEEEPKTFLKPLADLGRSFTRRLSSLLMPMVPAQIIKAEWEPPDTSLFVSHSCGAQQSKAPFVTYAPTPCTPPSGSAFTSHVTWPLHKHPFVSHAA